MICSLRRAAACLLLSLPCASPLHAEPELAPGYGELGYAAPEPGTYRLPPLGAAGDGEVLDSDGSVLRLNELYGDRIVILSLIYSSCSDVNGCPLATHVLHQVQTRLLRDEKLRDRVRLISLSFDPRHDTPEVMRAYAAHHQARGGEWRFLTTGGEDQLAPLLASFDHAIGVDPAADGKSRVAISHILRVYLVDERQQVRNIYSPSFLHADTLMSDIRTLATEAP